MMGSRIRAAKGAVSGLDLPALTEAPPSNIANAMLQMP